MLICQNFVKNQKKRFSKVFLECQKFDTCDVPNYLKDPKKRMLPREIAVCVTRRNDKKRFCKSRRELRGVYIERVVRYDCVTGHAAFFSLTRVAIHWAMHGHDRARACVCVCVCVCVWCVCVCGVCVCVLYLTYKCNIRDAKYVTYVRYSGMRARNAARA